MAVWDVDGTLAQYHHHLRNFAIQYWNMTGDLPALYSEWDGEGEFEDYLMITKAQYREMKLAFRAGGMKRTMPLYTGAVAALEQLQNTIPGLETWIVTQRPWLRMDNIDPDTRWWLNEVAGIKYNFLIFGENKYEEMQAQLDFGRVVICVEDLRDQVEVAAKMGLPVYQVARHHNRADAWLDRISDEAIVDRALVHYKTWRDMNGG